MGAFLRPDVISSLCWKRCDVIDVTWSICNMYQCIYVYVYQWPDTDPRTESDSVLIWRSTAGRPTDTYRTGSTRFLCRSPIRLELFTCWHSTVRERAFPYLSATWKPICSDWLSPPVPLQAPLYLRTSRRYRNVLLLLLLLLYNTWALQRLVGWQEGHLTCKKFCLSNHQRFIFGRPMGDAITPGMVPGKIGGLNKSRSSSSSCSGSSTSI